MSFQSKCEINKPRAPKNCRWCGESCPAGQKRIYHAWGDGADFQAACFHPECDEALVVWWALNPRLSAEEAPDPFEMERGKTTPRKEAE